MDKQNCVLIVDDERFNLKVLTEFLHEDYKIMAVRTGEQALKAVQGSSLPDLILLDIMMPGIEGYEVCKKIKQDEKTSHIPIIFVTVISEAMDAAKAFEFGAVDYITKPFNPVTVKARVKTHIQLNNTMRNLEAALKDVKKLSGLLPICSNCKKIRDDKGYWSQIEAYIRDHSETEFSHGICPGCSDELYGKEDWYIEMKKEKSQKK
ncbi:MAG: response regulator [Desulfobacula sp.]|jgi:PleD family two-component response regulator|nr:response regulator [Desulfobacula sp.]